MPDEYYHTGTPLGDAQSGRPVPTGRPPAPPPLSTEGTAPLPIGSASVADVSRVADLAAAADPPSRSQDAYRYYQTMYGDGTAAHDDHGTAAPQAPPAASGAAFSPPPAQPAYAQPAPDQPVSKKKWWIAPLVIVALLALMGIAMASCVSSLSGLAGFDGGSTGFEPDTVAVIDMGGDIGYDGTENSPEGLKYLLDEAVENDNIRAVVLRVNSGGGIAAAGEEMSTYLKNFVEESDKPVVVSSAALNASAAYMISAQANYIYVLNSTDIGSIGTIMQHLDLSELFAKLGVNIENIKSADAKDSSYYNRPLTEEERAEYQHQVDVINDNFIRMVAEGRKMSEEQVRALADGSTKVGQESVDAGLADGVGTFEDACDKAAELAGLDVEDYEVGYLSIASNDLGSLVGLLGSTGSQVELLDVIEKLGGRNAFVHER